MIQPQLGRERMYLEEFEADVELDYVIGGPLDDIRTTITQARVCLDGRELDNVEIEVFHLAERLQERLTKNAIAMAS